MVPIFGPPCIRHRKFALFCSSYFVPNTEHTWNLWNAIWTIGPRQHPDTFQSLATEHPARAHLSMHWFFSSVNIAIRHILLKSILWAIFLSQTL